MGTLDVNNDGTLTIKELVDGMKKQGINVDDASLAALDTDKSGTIDYSEFLAAHMSTRAFWKREELWAAFRAFDKDGNGKIEGKELQEVLGKASADIKSLIADADTNHDGVIDFEEFTAMMAK